MDVKLEEALAMAARDSDRVARTHAAKLGAWDRQQLVLAFHRAESLAEAALRDAISAASADQREGLESQLADERRHVQVFATWLGTGTEFTPPAPRRRPEHLSLGLLLANELAGFCQFHMLLGVIDEPPRRLQVEEILADERTHIDRLSRWLVPFWSQPRGDELRAALAAFSRRLAGRMHQFFPRPELEDLRAGMLAPMTDLIAAVPPA